MLLLLLDANESRGTKRKLDLADEEEDKEEGAWEPHRPQRTLLHFIIDRCHQFIISNNSNQLCGQCVLELASWPLNSLGGGARETIYVHTVRHWRLITPNCWSLALCEWVTSSSLLPLLLVVSCSPVLIAWWRHWCAGHWTLWSELGGSDVALHV